jgi:3-isopropylmalate/(R)-2-methylmalate dehydratase large subunit
MILQFGIGVVQRYARERGYLEVFAQAGVEVINPGCGACIGCGPGRLRHEGASHGQRDQPQLHGAAAGRESSIWHRRLTVAASAVEGRIVRATRPGMFKQTSATRTVQGPS